jgi:succinate dehydrogenase / fumarate reductase cytochrome b subunit
VLLGFSFALFFHLCNGIRHLFWDAGLGFELKTAYASGKAVIAVAIAMTLLAWALAYAMRGGG